MKKRVLVIEDNEQNLYLIRFLLEKSGYEVFTAIDGSEGLLMAQSVSPHIILLDIQLPTTDGYEVARRMRLMEELQSVPIVAVTSHAMPGDREKALEAGCDGYIEKPIDPDTFLGSMERHFKDNQP